MQQSEGPSPTCHCGRRGVLLERSFEGRNLRGLHLFFEQFEEAGEPCGMSRPGGSGDQISVHDRLIEGDFDVFPAGQPDFGSDGRVAGQFSATDDAGSG